MFLLVSHSVYSCQPELSEVLMFLITQPCKLRLVGVARILHFRIYSCGSFSNQGWTNPYQIFSNPDQICWIIQITKFNPVWSISLKFKPIHLDSRSKVIRFRLSKKATKIWLNLSDDFKRQIKLSFSQSFVAFLENLKCTELREY